jgi:hypothetical protein
MYKDYTYRYMDISKCDVIRAKEICEFCGWELEFEHYSDNRLFIHETIKCKGCGKLIKTSKHSLH